MNGYPILGENLRDRVGGDQRKDANMRVTGTPVILRVIGRYKFCISKLDGGQV